MTRERIKDFKEIVLPFFTNYLLKVNYENLGKSDAEEFEKDFSEIIELADKALEQQPCEDAISRQAAIEAIMGEPTDAHYPSWYAKRLEQLPSAQPERWMDGCGYCDYRLEHKEDDEVIITCGHPERTLYKEGQIPKWAAKDCRIAHCPKSKPDWCPLKEARDDA